MRFDKNGDLVPDNEPTEQHDVKDTRDLRDPQKLGERLLSDHAEAPHWKLHEIYDQGKAKHEIPDYAHGESIAQIAAREYREELETRTDKYAKSALEQLAKGERVVNDDPAGN